MEIRKMKNMMSLMIVAILLMSVFIPLTYGANLSYVNGFDKGPSYTSVVPTKEVTLVNYDEDSLVDDYAYLASVPTAVFKDQKSNRMFSHPLLFYKDEMEIEDDKERSFNSYQGVKYFMDDWMGYSDNTLDEINLINVKEEKASQWKSNKVNEISSNNPFDIAKKVSLRDWSYSDEAVVAVIEEEFEKPEYEFSSEMKGTLESNKEIISKTFFNEQLDKINPRPHFFNIPEGYKYLKARTWWASFWFGTPATSDLPLHVNATIPAADPDTQFFCKHEDEWMQVAATQGWNIGGMDKEKAETYIYTSGEWYYTLTDVPTFAKSFGKNGKFIDILKNMMGDTRYQTDITIYPGIEKEIPELPPFGCRDANFELSWNNENVELGFSIIGPYGEEIISKTEGSSPHKIHLDQLGELTEGQNYKISIYQLGELNSPVDYKITYSWDQNYSKSYGNSLSSATEGAILASNINAPLLYIKKDEIPECTKDVLYKLGVKKLYLANIGDELDKNVRSELNNIANIKEEYQILEDIYSKIMDLTGQNDVIFSTIDPFTYWYVTDLKPGGETKAGLFVGPAAYAAAHHGSPVVLVDMHPETSSAVVWHNEFWKRNAKGHPEPTIAPMYLTIIEVVEFLKDIGINRDGQESMLTVSGQYDIGVTWDRAFVGVTKPGRIFGSPVDTSYWISRDIFYPALIFENPAMDPDGVKLIQGSYSKRRNILPWGKNGLKIVKQSKEETFKHPVLQLYLTYGHKLNDRFSKYYGFRYNTADNIIPGVTPSGNPIDKGAVPERPNEMIWPDFTDSEVTPFYLDKGGYDNVFSTNFDVFMENLNRGTLLFVSSSHGTGANSGLLISWDPSTSVLGTIAKKPLFGYEKESNPWRGYDWYLGSTEEPDTMTMEIHGILPALLSKPDMNGLLAIGLDYWPSERPIFEKLTNIPIIKWFLPNWLKDHTDYKDGMVGAFTLSSGTASDVSVWTGYNMDDGLTNVHSCGWLNGACLPAYTYMHLTMIRHGSSFQVMDPWPTSWYAYWSITMPRDIALGKTVGGAYTKGIEHVGILYATDPPQWWWDMEQNVCYFGDPDIRMYVPDTTYSDANHWDISETKPIEYDQELCIDGHAPFGAMDYPNEREPQPILPIWLIAIIGLVIILLLALVLMRKKK